MFVYISLFAFSLAGIFIIFWRHFSEVKKLSKDEIKLLLNSSRSVRKDLRERYFDPAKGKFYEIYLPAFWRVSEKMVKVLRVLVLRFETKLKHLSENLRGRHVNLEVREKSEYWQTLNDVKQGNNKAVKDLHKTEGEHQKSLPVEIKKDNNTSPGSPPA